MRMRVSHIVGIGFAVLLGLVLGILFQKYCGIENTLDTICAIDLSSLPEARQGGEAGIPEAYQGKLQLFILAGQSNMAGWGDLPDPASEPDPRVYVFGNDYRWKLAVDPVDDPSNQVDRVSEDLEAGFGPSLSFASVVLERYPDMVIGLIPCATGNSSIDEWQRGLSDQALYGSCLKRTRAASTMGNIAGLLFFQGEADALDPRQHRRRTLLPDQWADYFAVFVSDWRSDLGLPDLPVVYAEIGTTTTPDVYPNWEIVRGQQRQVQLPFVAMITTKDLTLQDQVHFSTDGYRMIGRRFAEAYFAILEEQ